MKNNFFIFSPFLKRRLTIKKLPYGVIATARTNYFIAKTKLLVNHL